jgi:hypothetical protein
MDGQKRDGQTNVLLSKSGNDMGLCEISVSI